MLETNPDSELNTITNAALGLLARREYSTGELQERLARRTKNQDLVDTVLAALQEQGLQSDERFSEHFVRYKIDQGKGPHRIKQDLRQKHVPDDLIDRFVSNDSEFWAERAAEVYSRKFKDLPLKDEKDKAKRLRFMVSRGFSAHQVFDLIG
jgi:regulatory protein